MVKFCYSQNSSPVLASSLCLMHVGFNRNGKETVESDNDNA